MGVTHPVLFVVLDGQLDRLVSVDGPSCGRISIAWRVGREPHGGWAEGPSSRASRPCHRPFPGRADHEGHALVNSDIRPAALLLSVGQAVRNPRHPLQLLDGRAQTVHRPARLLAGRRTRTLDLA